MTDSLALAGLVPAPQVALVETARPTRRPYARVVCQNAWNFLPRTEYIDLIGDYAPRRRSLYAARRAVAALNTRRAIGNVVLSEYMGDLLTAQGRRTILTPVTLPWDLCAAGEVAAAGAGNFPLTGGSSAESPAVERPFVLVPGTLTWYKNPGYALDLAARIPAADRPLVVFAGTDDGSGCASQVRQRAADEGITCWIGPVDRRSMKWLLVHTAVTLIPSRLESLSLSMSEALLLSQRVAATPLPVHREMARRLDRVPVWLTEDPAKANLDEILAGDSSGAGQTDVAIFRDQWFDLARVLTTSAEGDA